MVSFKEVKNDLNLIDNIINLPKRPQLCWHHGFYDGPLTGICLYNDKPHWFNVIDEFDLKEDEEIFLGRVFVILSLTDEQYSIIKDRHDVFRNYIGCHTDYDENNKRKYMSEEGGQALIEYDNKKYTEIIDTKPDFPDLSNNPVVAWWGNKLTNWDAIFFGALK